MNGFTAGVLTGVLFGVLFGGVLGPPFPGLFPLVSGLPSTMTLSPFARRPTRPAGTAGRVGLLHARAKKPETETKSWSPVGPGRRPVIRPEELFLLSQTLTDRDWRILRTVARVHLITAHHIERLHFHDLKESTRPVVRRRVLKRLTDSHLIIALPRRVGGNQHGSRPQTYALDIAGTRILDMRDDGENTPPRKLHIPGMVFQKHRLTITELYVRLQEISRLTHGQFQIIKFQTEPECWWPYISGDGDTFLKPDAMLYAALDHATYGRIFWIEVDLGTESITRIRHKIETYAAFANRRAGAPNGVMPIILFTTPDTARRDTIRKTATAVLGESSTELTVRAECFEDAPLLIDDLPAGDQQPR